jgi:glycosyltransferase involved in cell wall biosynthesis
MERECALLGDAFARLGWEPVVITEQLGLKLPRGERVGSACVLRIPSSEARSLLVQLRVVASLVQLIVRYRRTAAFAVVRTTTLPALVVGLMKLMRLITFPTLVTAETGGVDDDVVALGRRPLFRVSRTLLSANDRLNGICDANVAHLRELQFPESMITMIPNGVDISAWDATTAPERVNHFLFLGRIEPAKGVFELLEAFGAVHAKHPQVRLTLAGDGPSRPELEERTAESGVAPYVRFVGRVAYEDLGTLFAEVDCLVLPSYSEGMPLSVLEAAAHRRVLVLSDVGDMRRLFGDNAHICQPRDAQSLAVAMEAAIVSNYQPDGYENVVHDVAIDNVAQRMLAALGVGRGKQPDAIARKSQG